VDDGCGRIPSSSGSMPWLRTLGHNVL